jgi:hypothetical protein
MVYSPILARSRVAIGIVADPEAEAEVSAAEMGGRGVKRLAWRASPLNSVWDGIMAYTGGL